MKILLALNLAAPFFGALLVGSIGRKSEALTSRIVTAVEIILGLSVLLTLLTWGYRGFTPFEWNVGNIYENGTYHFPIVLYFDLYSAVFMAVINYMFLVIARFSRYYMHREEGYSRFFSTVLLFIVGMNGLVVAGTVDLLFAGWEVVGISSFLLIAFYRHRVTPVRNAVTVYGVYRICDVGVLLGAWLSYVIWHRSQLFSDLQVVMEHQAQSPALLVLSLVILFAAAGKSAQFPFCFWLPRAMEGPTPSSAIFYGALSVHAGLFLLLRTYPVWHSVAQMPWIVGGVGLVSAVLGTLCGKTQSNIKGQIGYSSLSQVGLMLVELAAGFPKLALLHFVGNAGIRAYQLLVSPSVVAYVLRMQGTPGTQRPISQWSIEKFLPPRLRSTLYVLSFSEGYLLAIVRGCLLRPLSKLGHFFHSIDSAGGRWLASASGLVLFSLIFADLRSGLVWLSVIAAVLSVGASLSALAERKSATRTWNTVGFSCLFSAVAILFTKGHLDKDLMLYFIGVIPPWIIGNFILKSLLRGIESRYQLEDYWGLVHRFPRRSFWLFICLLALVGFPVGPAFVGEDALLHHILESEAWLVLVYMFTFVVNGVSLVAMFARVTLGPEENPQSSSVVLH